VGSVDCADCWGGFALLKWRDQLRERRYEQYWKLVTICQQSAYLEQKVALLLLKRYPESKSETVEFLRDASSRSSGWAGNNKAEVKVVLDHFSQ
jgi:hypothetical protein